MLVQVVMEAPDNQVVLFNIGALLLENRVIRQPIRLIEVVIESRFMRDDQVCPQSQSLKLGV